MPARAVGGRREERGEGLGQNSAAQSTWMPLGLCLHVLYAIHVIAYFDSVSVYDSDSARNLSLSVHYLPQCP